jgi:hypothetical protein
VPRLPSCPLYVRRATLVGTLVAALSGAGCGVPPEVRTPGAPVPTPGPSSSAPVTGPPTLPPITRPPPAPPTPAEPSFAEGYAVDCAGHPTGAQVVRVLRRAPGLIGRGVRVTVRTGPLCAGTWQYTVVTVPGSEPLAVVTQGRPSDLSLVTAGTDVCSIPVRTAAPAGILAAAACQ